MAPAIFALLGLAGIATAPLFISKLTPVLVALSALFLMRAHYVLYAKKHGSRTSIVIVWGATAVATVMFLWRWGFWI